MIPGHLVFQPADLLDNALPFSNLGIQLFLWIGLLGLQRVYMACIVKLIDHASDDDWPPFDHSFVPIESMNEMLGYL
jgi:hypothetical protein